MNNQKRNRKSKQGKKKKNPINMPRTSFVPKSSWKENIIPTEFDDTLVVVNNFTLSQTASGVINRYNTNSAYAPQVGGSVAVTPGFSHMANFYGFYRVVAYSYEVTFVNKQAFALNCFCLNMNNDPTTTPTTQITANPLSQHKVVSGVGGIDQKTLKGYFTIAEVAGTNAVEDGDSYRALNNASPADLFWLGVGISSLSGANVTLGADVQFYLRQHVRWFDRLQQ